MTDLTWLDSQALLQSISILNSDLSVATLPSRAFESVSNCISCEITGLDGWKKSGLPTGSIRYDPDDWVTPELMMVFGAFAPEHPLAVPLVIEKYPGALRISDRVTRRQFHSTGLFNEFYKEIGVHEQLIVALDVGPDSMVTCALNRSHQDFSERDRAMLDLLRPHLTAAFKNTYAFSEVVIQNHYLQRTATKGIVILDREGNVRSIDDRSAELLTKYFANFKRDLLPAQLSAFVENEIVNLRGPDPFVPEIEFRERKEASELRVTLGFEDRDETIWLLLEESYDLAAHDFLPLGLTKRESEILSWVAKGKTDDVIAILCGISSRTVQKHIQHIRQKLNVETRTAAVHCAQNLIGSGNGLSRNAV